MTQGKNAAPVQSTLPAVAAAEVGDVMDAFEVGGDGVGAGPASNENATVAYMLCIVI